jgi:hypothetical protein
MCVRVCAYSLVCSVSLFCLSIYIYIYISLSLSLSIAISLTISLSHYLSLLFPVSFCVRKAKRDKEKAAKAAVTKMAIRSQFGSIGRTGSPRKSYREARRRGTTLLYICVVCLLLSCVCTDAFSCFEVSTSLCFSRLVGFFFLYLSVYSPWWSVLSLFSFTAATLDRKKPPSRK